MEAVILWKGVKRNQDGNDLSNFVYVKFEGEKLGEVAYGDHERGVIYTFYRTSDGQIVLHEVDWSKWLDEADYGNVLVFSSIEAAAENHRLLMERAGLIERVTMSLDEYVANEN